MNSLQYLFTAIAEGHESDVRAIAEAKPELVGAADELGKTCLHVAAQHDRVAMAEWLLEQGAAVGSVAAWGHTSLTWAANCGASGVAGLLLSRGAGPYGHEQTVRFLVEHGADVTRCDHRFNADPAAWAKEGGHDGLASWLASLRGRLEAQ